MQDSLTVSVIPMWGEGGADVQDVAGVPGVVLLRPHEGEGGGGGTVGRHRHLHRLPAPGDVGQRVLKRRKVYNSDILDKTSLYLMTAALSDAAAVDELLLLGVDYEDLGVVVGLGGGGAGLLVPAAAARPAVGRVQHRARVHHVPRLQGRQLQLQYRSYQQK